MKRIFVICMVLGYTYCFTQDLQNRVEELKTTCDTLQSFSSLYSDLLLFSEDEQKKWEPILDDFFTQLHSLCITKLNTVRTLLIKYSTGDTTVSDQLNSAYYSLYDALNNLEKNFAPNKYSIEERYNQLASTGALDTAVQKTIDDFKGTCDMFTTTLNLLFKTTALFPETDRISTNTQITNGIKEISAQCTQDLNAIQTQHTQIKTTSDVGTKQSLFTSLLFYINEQKTKFTKIIAPIVLLVNDKKAELDRTGAIERAEEDLKNRTLYHQKIVNFYNELDPHINEYNSIAKSARELIQSEINTGSVEVDQLSNYLNQFKSVATSFLSIYKKYGFTIHPDDLSNYVVSTYRKMIGLCCDDLAIISDNQSGKLAIPTAKQDAYDKLAMLAIRILGSSSKKLSIFISRIPESLYSADNDIMQKGYDGVFDELFTKDFASLLKEYAERKKHSSFTAYQNALQDLSVTVTHPQEQDFGYAQLFFEKLDEDLTLLLPAIADKFRQTYAQFIANLGFAYVHNIFTTMKTDAENQTLRDEAISVFRTLASYFERAQDKKNEAKYQSFAQMIIDAQNALAAARIETDKDKALALFQQAFEKFAQVGDARDATEAHIEMQKLTVNFNRTEGISLLTTYLQQHTQWKTYLENINILGNDFLLDNATDALFSDLGVASLKARSSYIKSYNAQQKIVDSLSTGTEQNMQIFHTADLILNNLGKSMQPLLDGTDAARKVLHTSNDQNYASEQLNKAEYYFDIVRNYFSAADDQWNDNVSLLIPMYPSVIAATDQDIIKTIGTGKRFTLMTLLGRHIANLYIAIAQRIESEDMLSAIQFYSTAKSYSPYLPKDIVDYLENKVRSFQEQQDAVTKIFNNAEAKQKEAMALTVQDWQPLQPTGIYESKASQIWQHVLDLYTSAFQAWYEEAESSLIDAAETYAQAYQKNVPGIFHPELGTAMIYYYQFVMYHKHNYPLKAEAVLGKMNPLVTAFLDEFEKNTQIIASAFDSDNIAFIETATTSQAYIDSMRAYLTIALSDQKHIRDSLVRSDDRIQEGFLLLTMTADSSNNIQTLSYLPTKRSINFTQFARSRADLYHHLAEIAFEKGENDIAFTAFQEANKYYHDLGMDDVVNTMAKNFQLAKTRSLADKYRFYVIPNEKDSHGIAFATVAGISVPEQYEIAIFEQQWPSDLPVAPDIIEYAKNPEQSMPDIIKNELIDMAAQLYYYQALKDYNIAYQDAANLAKTGPTEIKQILDELAKKADSFKAELNTRVSVNHSKVYLRGDDGGALYFGIVYLPVAGVPLKVEDLPYSRFPYAYLFYSAAFKLYGTEPVSIHGVMYVPGNDAAMQQALLANMAQTHISDAQRIKKENQSTINAVISKVKSISKSDFSIDLSAYVENIAQIKSVYNDVMAPHYYHAQIFYKNIGNVANHDALNNERGNVYVELSQLLSNFLIGDPLADDYQDLLWQDLDLYYKFALNIFQDPKKFADLLTKYAALKINGGNLLIQVQKKYFAAFTFYGRAYQTLKSIPQPSQDVSNQIRDAHLHVYSAAFYGSTKNILEYAQAKKELTLGDGIKMTLQDLIKKNHEDGSYIEEYNKYKKMILDALIFYSYVSTGASKMMYPDSDEQSQTPEQQADDPVMKDAQEAINKYMQDNTLTFSGVDDVIAFLWQDNAELVINGAFDSFVEEIKKATTDAQAGYAKMFVWINRLYLIFSQLYMHDFLAGVLPKDLWTQLSTDIKAEAQDIGSPSSQYL